MFYTFYTAIKRFYTAIKRLLADIRRASRRLVRGAILCATVYGGHCDKSKKHRETGERNLRERVCRTRDAPAAHQQQPHGEENRRSCKRRLCYKMSHFIRWL